MFINDYVPEEYTKVFDCEDGLHIVRIGAVRVCNSKSGNQMLEVALSVEDNPAWYIERYVSGEYFNKNITRFFDAFGIQRGNFNFDTWKGHSTKAWFVHETSEYTGSDGLPKTSVKSVLKKFEFGNASSFGNAPSQPAAAPNPQAQMAQMGMQPAASLPRGTVQGTVQGTVPQSFSQAPAEANIPPELSVFPEDIPF